VRRTADHLNRAAPDGVRRRADETAKQGHEERRAKALVAHIPNDEHDGTPGRQQEGVVKVARHLAGRTQHSVELHSPRGRERFGQEIALDVAGDVHLAREALGSPRAPAIQRGA
jgi:hypothetical protein